MRRHFAPVARPIAPWLPGAVGVVLAALDLHAYLGDPAHPGGKGRIWWQWWDQSHYLESARSLAQGDLQATHYWYPPGYAMVGAPFTALTRLHPFLLPDLVCLLATYLAFLVFARAVGVAPGWAATLFLLATCGSASIRTVWAVPWNTTLSSALIWWLLALTAARARRATGEAAAAQDRSRRLAAFATMGALAAAIPFIRPIDAILVLVWAVGGSVCLACSRILRCVDLLAFAAGAAILLVPEAFLWMSIYGLHPSQYMRDSRVLGFAFGSVGWRSYLLLLAPQPWFPYGEGILPRLVWILPGLAGILALPWTARGVAGQLLGLLAVMILTYSLVFFAYVDMIPSGLWRYQNIHYLKWVFPGLVLLGFQLLRALVAGPRRPALAAVTVTLLLFMLRMPPHQVGERDPAWLIHMPGASPGWDMLYFGRLSIHDDQGSLAAIRDFRAMPDQHGWRLIALTRPFVGIPVLSGIAGWRAGRLDAAHGATRWDRAFGTILQLCRPLRCAQGP